MKFLKALFKKIGVYLGRICDGMNEVNYGVYLHERELNEARERARLRAMQLGRGGWL